MGEILLGSFGAHDQGLRDYLIQNCLWLYKAQRQSITLNAVLDPADWVHT
jgi:hypothetical protein